MNRDIIVEEVRAARDAFAKDHDYDIEAIFSALRELEAKSARTHVRLAPRRRRVPVIGAAQQGVAADGASPRG